MKNQPIKNYGSVSEFLAVAASEAPANPRNTGLLSLVERICGVGQDHFGAYYWAGYDKPMTKAGAKGLILTGWHDGLRRIEEAIGGLGEAPQPIGNRRRRIRGDFGDSVDMQRVYAGNLPQAWERMKRQPRAGNRKITLLVDALARAGADSDTIFWRGAAAVALCDSLTASGFNVEVIVGFAGNNDARNLTGARVTVKSSGMPLDKFALASAAHPSFFRYFGHRHGVIVEGRKMDSPSLTVAGIEKFDGGLLEGEILIGQDVSSEETARAKAFEVMESVRSEAERLAA